MKFRTQEEREFWKLVYVSAFRQEYPCDPSAEAIRAVRFLREAHGEDPYQEEES